MQDLITATFITKASTYVPLYSLEWAKSTDLIVLFQEILTKLNIPIIQVNMTTDTWICCLQEDFVAASHELSNAVQLKYAI